MENSFLVLKLIVYYLAGAFGLGYLTLYLMWSGGAREQSFKDFFLDF